MPQEMLEATIEMAKQADKCTCFSPASAFRRRVP
jgi:hypothetical protein